MATDRILTDSSILIEFFRKKKKDETLLYHLQSRYEIIYISVVTYYELLCGAKSDALYNDTIKLLELFEVIELQELEAKESCNYFPGFKKEKCVNRYRRYFYCRDGARTCPANFHPQPISF